MNNTKSLKPDYIADPTVPFTRGCAVGGGVKICSPNLEDWYKGVDYTYRQGALVLAPLTVEPWTKLEARREDPV